MAVSKRSPKLFNLAELVCRILLKFKTLVHLLAFSLDTRPLPMQRSVFFRMNARKELNAAMGGVWLARLACFGRQATCCQRVISMTPLSRRFIRIRMYGVNRQFLQ